MTKKRYHFESNDEDDIVIKKRKENDEKELIVIDIKVKTIKDLITLGSMYDSTKRYNIDMMTLNRMVLSLEELDSMIGMDNVKDTMVDYILFHLLKLDSDNMDMMHTVIQGPAGIGKTEVAKIIGKIYLAMGILKNDKFIKATRSQLIGQYLGQTAPKTQDMINKAIGGVLFIDEVYSLGNSDKKDSYAKECIDTINENLTIKKTDFICIVAGYKDEINKCFFAFNSGLDRRFPIRLTIKEYTPMELFLIFKKKAIDNKWNIDSSVTEQFFINNYKSFKFFGGDMELLFGSCKRCYARRILNHIIQDKVLNNSDLINGFEKFKEHRSIEVDKDDSVWKEMFL
jgi:hypothetical protein